MDVATHIVLGVLFLLILLIAFLVAYDLFFGRFGKLGNLNEDDVYLLSHVLDRLGFDKKVSSVDAEEKPKVLRITLEGTKTALILSENVPAALEIKWQPVHAFMNWTNTNPKSKQLSPAEEFADLNGTLPFVTDLTVKSFDGIGELLKKFANDPFILLATNCDSSVLLVLAEHMPQTLQRLHYGQGTKFIQSEFMSALAKMPQIRALQFEYWSVMPAFFFKYNVIRRLERLGVHAFESTAQGSVDDIFDVVDIIEGQWKEAYLAPMPFDAQDVSKILNAWIKGERDIERFAIMVPAVKMEELVNGMTGATKIKPMKKISENHESLKIKRGDGASLYVSLLRTKNVSDMVTLAISKKKLKVDSETFKDV